MSGISKKSEADAVTASGRFAAGEDPAKRRQILDGAKRVFMRMGFDAASMNDVTREAGVSKGTLYVYFGNKEDLFTAMIEAERAAFVAALKTALAEEVDLESSLYYFGMKFIFHITNEDVIKVMRTLIGVRPRMPALCQRFFNSPENLRAVLRSHLTKHVEMGQLVIEDMDLAAVQFLELASGSLFKFRLFGTLASPPSQEEADRIVRGAVRVFMAAYAKPKAV
ncbi:TetR/AcrR family transcriptional regulator [Oryzifoliimicrobium ureilyticus]|uniref:TetR/AcrR family transcriptional regulator n=1 Tax=Oryzifoliimicrobium ureilyticus TaxID=3113724 RepID=UPI0030760553